MTGLSAFPGLTAVLAAALTLAFFGTPSPPPANAAHEEPAVIAFNHDPDGTTQIYTVTLPGNEVEQLTGLTPLEGENVGPRWSPDGNRLAFASDRDGDWDIYTMAPDGSDVVKLSDRQGDQTSPAWSPNGLRIAFIQSEGRTNGIHLMESNGEYQRRLQNHQLELTSHLDWAPCRGSLLFTARSGRSKPSRAYVLRIRERTITEIDGAGGSMRWNRRCKRLIFTGSNGPPESTSLFTISRKGNNRRVVPTRFAKTYDRYHNDPAWSADGAWLAYGYMDHDCFYCTELRVLDLATGQDHGVLEANEVWFFNLDWKP